MKDQGYLPPASHMRCGWRRFVLGKDSTEHFPPTNDLRMMMADVLAVRDSRIIVNQTQTTMKAKLPGGKPCFT